MYASTYNVSMNCNVSHRAKSFIIPSDYIFTYISIYFNTFMKHNGQDTITLTFLLIPTYITYVYLYKVYHYIWCAHTLILLLLALPFFILHIFAYIQYQLTLLAVSSVSSLLYPLVSGCCICLYPVVGCLLDFYSAIRLSSLCLTDRPRFVHEMTKYRRMTSSVRFIHENVRLLISSMMIIMLICVLNTPGYVCNNMCKSTKWNICTVYFVHGVAIRPSR